jgi:two-component system, OmpR family, alkaline phosphatase synthesis response regulator PhoP
MKKILIVEDDAAILFSVSKKLELIENVQVLTAEDGEKGLATALSEKPDLILLDIVMPKMDGIEMLKKLRQDDWGKKAKVIILSNLSNSKKYAEAKKLGVTDYIIKADWKLADVAAKVMEKLAE